MASVSQVPAVSVVIPTYNRAEDLRRCLESLVAQTLQDFEVLVCDDGSTDHTAMVAEEFQGRLNLRYEYAENFGGPARPRNRGVAAARAPYVAFLDSDDWWAPSKLEMSLAALENGADVVYHDLWVATSPNQTVFRERLRSTAPSKGMFERLLCTGMSIPNSSVVVRAEVLSKLEGICEDKELISVEDYDTWIRLARHTEKFVKIDGCLGYYWNGGGNISVASPKQITRITALYRRHIDSLPDGARRRATGFLAYRVGRLAFILQDRKASTENFQKALFSPIDLEYRLKALFFLVRGFRA